MRRMLCVAGATLALVLSSAGVAFAADAVPSAKSQECKAAESVEAAARVAFDNAANAEKTKRQEFKQPDSDGGTAITDTEQAQLNPLTGEKLRLQDALNKATKDREKKCAEPVPPARGNVAIRTTCADYARFGEFNFVRGIDPRYRGALDQDNDGRACERNGDDSLRLGLPNLNGRDCDTLKADFNRAEDEVEEARRSLNRTNRQARQPGSPEGDKLSAEERHDIRVAARVIDDRIRDRDAINDKRREVCKDTGGDITVNVTVDPIEPVVLNESDRTAGNSQVSRVPVGGVETGHVA